jgi:hypothetical protein
VRSHKWIHSSYICRVGEIGDSSFLRKLRARLPNYMMLLITVDFENHTKSMNTGCGQNAVYYSYGRWYIYLPLCLEV